MGEDQETTPKRLCIREPFCGLSHLTGAILSLVGLIVLIVLSHGKPWHIVAFTIYGTSLIALYTASTLYHSLHVAPHHLKWLQKWDYAAIFLLIAGTYTPICLVSLRGAWGWSLLAAQYSLALIGILSVFAWRWIPHWFRVVHYVVMGWLIMVAIVPLANALPLEALIWCIAGGLCYSIGVVVYATDHPHLLPGRFTAHDLWHVFVLGGSTCHFMVMIRHIVHAA